MADTTATGMPPVPRPDLQDLQDRHDRQGRQDDARLVLDPEAGLRRVLGKQATYHTLLRRFVSQHADAATRIAGLLQSGDGAAATREAHTLKGVAGTLGARTVQAHSADLEGTLRHGGPTARAAEVLALLRTSLDEAVRAMHRLLDDAPPGPEGSTDTHVPGDAGGNTPSAAPDTTAGPDRNLTGGDLPETPPHALPDMLPDMLLDRLETLIEEDDSEAVDLFNTHTEALRAALGQALVVGMGEALRAFEFETALEMLRSARPAREG